MPAERACASGIFFVALALHGKARQKAVIVDLPLCELSFLICKIGQRGSKKEEAWGAGVVNKIPLGSKDQ